MGWTVCIQIPARARYFLFSILSRPALRLTQLAIKLVSGFFPGDKVAGVQS
jgi:hypothetical protein